MIIKYGENVTDVVTIDKIENVEVIGKSIILFKSEIVNGYTKRFIDKTLFLGNCDKGAKSCQELLYRMFLEGESFFDLHRNRLEFAGFTDDQLHEKQLEDERLDEIGGVIAGIIGIVFFLGVFCLFISAL